MEENDFECGYCGRHTSSDKGLMLRNHSRPSQRSQDSNNGVYICTYCQMPTLKWDDIQVPGNRYGEDVKNVPELIITLYDETRNSFAANAFTAVILLSRKILMHISVELGAEEGKNFKHYVDYLEKENHITANSKPWVDFIRDKGNQSNHEIEISTKEEAELMIKFIEMILKNNFEYSALVRDREE